MQLHLPVIMLAVRICNIVIHRSSVLHSQPTWFSLSSVTLGALFSVGPGWKSSTLVAALLCETGQHSSRTKMPQHH
jgi:hypothetical protein